MITLNRPFKKMAAIGTASIIGITMLFSTPAISQQLIESEGYLYQSPIVPSEIWTIAAGGRIYDKWWAALDRDEPTETNPAYPELGQQSGSTTWRCKECHGWDYQGAEGVYASGSHFTGIGSLNGAIGAPVEQLMATLRDDNHPYTQEMITDAEMARVAVFVSRGQVDMSQFIDLENRRLIGGNVDRGRGVFQTVCAACHGFDGRWINWGSGDENNFVGTEAAGLPDEVMNKILNAHPGAQMVNLRAFPLQYAIDVLAYAATLPVDID